jgi:very-short-patch-repair endonuclease
MTYTEDSLVQQTTANYLEQQLGWQSVLAWNNEGFGPSSLLGRASDREVVLTRTLREKLTALNPGLPDVAYEDAVRQITATVASQTLVATNREKYTQMRDGVQVTFRTDKGERVRQRLRVFDFDTPENNDFLCVRELWVRGDLYRRRADIVGFVNGLPLLFIECKNLHKNLKTAFERNFSDYRDTIPHLFHHNAMVMFGNGEQAKIGSITSRWEHFNEWKRLAEETPGTVDMETLLKGVCDKRNFLDLVENFILFDESAGEPKKIIARNHQFLGVNRAVAAVARRYAAIARPLTPALSQDEREASGSKQAVHIRGGYDFAGLVQRARELRQAQTPAEEIFWELVRDRRFLGLKFRRQHQYGDYILDFYCHEAALAVEFDGGIHDTPEKKNKDTQRDGYLKSQGVHVVHVRNDTLINDPEGTLKSLANTLPSPSGSVRT